MRIFILMLILSMTVWANANTLCPELSYQWSSGRGRVNHASVQIDNKGHVEASITKRNGNVEKYTTSLNQFEVNALKLAISSSDIFNLELPDTPTPTCIDSKSSISIKTEERQKDLTYAHAPTLRPLTVFLHGIITQADFADAAFDNDRIYHLLGTIDHRHAYSKVLQPYLFREPLEKSLSAQKEFQQIAWRLQALSCITTPIEFSGIVDSQLDRSDITRWRLWLTTLSTPECYNNLHKEHLESLFPLFSDQLQRYGDTAKTLETPEGEAFRRFRMIMLNYNYSQN